MTRPSSVLDAGARYDEALSPPERRWFDAVLAGSTLILGLLTVATVGSGQPFVTVNGTLDVIVNTLTAVAAAGAAALGWNRYRIEREVAAIYESAAFLILCSTRGLVVAIAASGSQDSLGMSLDAPQQWPLYAWSLARLASAILLVIAAAATLRRVSSTRVPTILLELGPVAAVLVAFLGLQAIESALPPLLGPQGFSALRGTPGAVPGMDLLGLVIQGATAATYFAGALLYRRLLRERGRKYMGYLSIGLIVAAFSQFQWATSPGIYRPLVTVDDLLRALFSIILLTAIDAQFRSDVRDLRAANARMRALRAADADRATLEAGARLARDVHDGLAQDLWLAKLHHAKIRDLPDLPPDAAQPLADLGKAVDRALRDSRAVVEAMRGEGAAIGLGDSLLRVIGDFEEDSGVAVEFTTEGPIDDLDESPAREVVGVLQEALVNVLRHAEATSVRISAVADGGLLRLSVVDNGRGFDPRSVGESSFGLRSMRERAASAGGELHVVSRAADGTSIVMAVPRRPASAIA